MATEDQRYWFPAKRYGWGWSFPRTWEGWTVILAFTAVVLIVAIAGGAAVWQMPVILLATIVVLVICLKKGEPTRWRWGGDK
jgi:hypothetical protein